MDAVSRPRAWKVSLAFAIIYLVWGSTFLAIRVGVREVPPFLLAGMRFLVAGVVLFGWMRARGTPSPTVREWGGVSFLAILIFVFDYGLLFWAERRVPSGIAAVMMATIPVFMTLAEIVFLRTQRLTLRLGIALLVGMAGVAVLVGHTMSLGEAPVDTAGACALIFAAISWSVAASLSRKLPLPAAKAMSSGAQMLAGGVLLNADGGSAGRIPRLPCASGVARGVACVGVFDCGRIDRRLHGVCLAASPRIADQGGDLRVCESSGRCSGGIFSGRRSDRSADRRGNIAGAGQRGGDHDHTCEKSLPFIVGKKHRTPGAVR